MCDAPDRSDQEIEKKIADMPHPVLDVVAKDPQVKHVSDDMKPVAVQEHRRDKGNGQWQQRGARGKLGLHPGRNQSISV